MFSGVSPQYSQADKSFFCSWKLNFPKIQSVGLFLGCPFKPYLYWSVLVSSGVLESAEAHPHNSISPMYDRRARAHNHRFFICMTHVLRHKGATMLFKCMTDVRGPSTARIFYKCMTHGRAHLINHTFHMYVKCARNHDHHNDFPMYDTRAHAPRRKNILQMYDTWSCPSPQTYFSNLWQTCEGP